jgi:uncharacterized protein (UPF0332 family)
MSFDWRHYLTLAEHLFDNAGALSDKEACYRSVASRAYYAVFCLARNYVRDTDNARIEMHQELQDYLTRNRNNKARCKIGNQLKRLHQIRKKADYDDDLHALPINTASQALAQAKKIFEGINQLL